MIMATSADLFELHVHASYGSSLMASIVDSRAFASRQL